MVDNGILKPDSATAAYEHPFSGCIQDASSTWATLPVEERDHSTPCWFFLSGLVGMENTIHLFDDEQFQDGFSQIREHGTARNTSGATWQLKEVKRKRSVKRKE